MNKEDRLPTLLFVVVVAIIAAFAGKRFLAKKSTVETAPTTITTQQPTPFPVEAEPEQTESEPTPIATPVATPPPTPTPFANPMQFPGIGNNPGGKAMDPKQIKELMEKMAKAGGDKTKMPRNLGADMMQSAQRMQKALNSEADARAALPDLANCANQSGNFDAANANPAPGMAATIASAATQARSACANTAKQIAEKYPSLKNEIDNKILKPAGK